jgi:TRAP-type mannitol/chloroaromatic compound transport system substrate-binding protein
MYDGLDEVCKLIARSSGGRLIWKLHPADALVPATQEFDGIDGGVIQVGLGAVAYWKDKFPAAGFFTFTVAGLSPMESMLWWNFGGGKDLCHEMIADYDVIAFSGEITPPEVFLQSTKPLDTLDDIKGLRIRTGGDDGEIFDRMGASVVFMPAGEIYEGIQRGVLDAAQASTPAIDWSLSLQEVCDYMYLSGVRQPTDWSVVTVKKSAFKALPDDLQAIVEAEMGAMTPRFYGWLTQRDSEAMVDFKEYGTNIAPASKEIVDELARQAKIFYAEKAAEDPFMAEVLQSIWDFQELYRELYDRL